MTAAGPLAQGLHRDPLDETTPTPDRAHWTARQMEAFESAAMDHFRSGLRLSPSTDIRASVLDDLTTYYQLSAEECVRRCRGWEQWSVSEWNAKSRSTRDGLAEFYRTTVSWAFDLLWYAYLQAEGYKYPVSAAVAVSIPQALAPGRRPRHLDFGSGIGATSQMFEGLGYDIDLADISTSLLSFARYRLERRSVRARYLDLNEVELEPEAYDVVTAIDTLVHVPDLAKTAATLHRSLRHGGLLFANFDVRPRSPENAWHLYSDDLPLRFLLQRTGFEPQARLDGMVTCYRRVEPSGLSHAARGVRDSIALRSPLRPLVRSVRSHARRRWART